MGASLQRLVVVVVACALVVSCATLRPVTLPTSPPTQRDMASLVAVGDMVRVTTKARRRLEFRVATVGATALMGERGERVAYADIETLDREAANMKGSTAAWTVLIAGGLVAFLIYLAYGLALASIVTAH